MSERLPQIYYVAQERALAPGIVKEWPKVIGHPADSNGRLVRLTDDECEYVDAVLIARAQDEAAERTQ